MCTHANAAWGLRISLILTEQNRMPSRSSDRFDGSLAQVGQTGDATLRICLVHPPAAILELADAPARRSRQLHPQFTC